MTPTDLEAKLSRVQAAGVAAYRVAAEAAEADGRPLDDDDRAALQELTASGRELRAQVLRARGLDPVLEELRALTPPPARERRSIGTQFVQSPAFEFFEQGGHRAAGAWESPVVEVSAAAIGGDPSSPMPTIGEIVPMRRVPLPPTIAELLTQGRTTANAVLYPREMNPAFTALVPTTPGAAKTQIGVSWETWTAPVVKQAGFVPISEELFEDLPGLAAYIDSRLMRAANNAVDADLYNQISTLSGRVPDHALAAPESNAQALLNQAVKVFAASQCIPDAIVIHPLAFWGTVAAGGQELVGAWLFDRGNNPSFESGYLFGMRLVPIAALPSPGKAIVGAFAEGGGIYWRDDFAIQVSNSHLDWFQKNLLALRGERRYAFVNYIAAAFGIVTGLNQAP